MYFSHQICKVQSFQSIFLSLSNERNVSLAVISIIIRTERYIAVPVQFDFFLKELSDIPRRAHEAPKASFWKTGSE